MIPDLLWRCPLCQVNDVLTHRQPWLRPEVVDCTACGARWRVRRVAGKGFYLKLVRRGARGSLSVGDERNLADWYALMKKTLRLETLPKDDRLLDFPLSEQESVYLASGAAELWAARPNSPPGGEADTRRVGRGQLFLTDQRFAWRDDQQQLDFPLCQVNGVYAVVNFCLALVVGQQLYQVLFDHESLLKWVTYAASLEAQMRTAQGKADGGHTLRTSHY